MVTNVLLRPASILISLSNCKARSIQLTWIHAARQGQKYHGELFEFRAGVARLEIMASSRTSFTVRIILSDEIIINMFSYKSIIIFFFFRCSCILTRMRKYAAALFLVVVVDSWYVVEEEDLCLLCLDFLLDLAMPEVILCMSNI